ncbi:MAG: hypothetical protein ACT4PJ_10455 [Gemmatimonadaceae bacterium]
MRVEPVEHLADDPEPIRREMAALEQRVAFRVPAVSGNVATSCRLTG